VLAERWRVYYNTRRPHSSLGYKPPAPEARMTEPNAGHGKVESKERLPLFHAPDCGYLTMIGPELICELDSNRIASQRQMHDVTVRRVGRGLPGA
jgi:Integrase core domain